MKTIGDVANGELIWQQPSALKESYELGAGGEVVAVLHESPAGPIRLG